MKASELIETLQGVIAAHGDLTLYMGDMKVPALDLSETVHEADFDTYGRKYLFIEEGRLAVAPLPQAAQEEGWLTLQDVLDLVGRSAAWLADQRKASRIACTKVRDGKFERLLFRKEDVNAFILKMGLEIHLRKRRTFSRSPDPNIVPVVMSCECAAMRYEGQTPKNIARMCLRGKYLAKRFGGASRVPAKEAAKAIFALKPGKTWQIPVAELDRVFLGKRPE